MTNDIPALQTAAQNILFGTHRVVLLQLVEAAVTVTRALIIARIALWRRAPRWSPQRAALVVVRSARALIAVRASVRARLRVAAIEVGRTVLRFAGAELGQIALAVVDGATLEARRARSACGQIAARTGGAGGVRMQHAGVRVATGVLAELGGAAVALLAALDEAVAARGRFEQLSGLVSSEQIQPVLEIAREIPWQDMPNKLYANKMHPISIQLTSNSS